MHRRPQLSVAIVLASLLVLLYPGGSNAEPPPTNGQGDLRQSVGAALIGVWSLDIERLAASMAANPTEEAELRQMLVGTRATITFGADGAYELRMDAGDGGGVEAESGTWVAELGDGGTLQVHTVDSLGEAESLTVAFDGPQFVVMTDSTGEALPFTRGVAAPAPPPIAAQTGGESAPCVQFGYTEHPIRRSLAAVFAGTWSADFVSLVVAAPSQVPVSRADVEALVSGMEMVLQVDAGGTLHVQGNVPGEELDETATWSVRDADDRHLHVHTTDAAGVQEPGTIYFCSDDAMIMLDAGGADVPFVRVP